MASHVLDSETLKFGRLLHYAGVAIALVCGAVGYAWFYSSIDTQIFDAVVRIDELSLSRQNAATIRQEHERLSKRLHEIGVQYEGLQQRVPLNAEAGSFLKYVSDIAREEDLVISNFQPASSVAGDGYTAMEVLLDGQGSFKSICSFFDRLAKIQRLSKVKNLTVKVEQQSETYPMQATIVIYFGLDNEATVTTHKETTHG